jgi:hypothetical protein
MAPAASEGMLRETIFRFGGVADADEFIKGEAGHPAAWLCAE